MRWTGRGRGLSATIVVLGTTVAVVVLALILLVPLVGSLRDFLHDLPDLVDELRDSDELSWLGDSGAAENVQQGANDLSSTIPDAISAILGVAGQAFSAGLTAFTLIFLALFLLVDMPRLKGALRSMLVPPRIRALARGLGERHGDHLALGDRRDHHRTDRRDDPGPRRLPARFQLRARARPDRGLPRPDPEHRRDDRGLHPRPDPVGRGGHHCRRDHARRDPRLPAGREQPARADDLRQGGQHLPFFVILGVTLFGALLGVLGALVAVPVTASLQIIVLEVTKAQRATASPSRAAAKPPAPKRSGARDRRLAVLEALWWGAFASSSLLIGGVFALRVTVDRLVLGLVMGFGAASCSAPSRSSSSRRRSTRRTCSATSRRASSRAARVFFAGRRRDRPHGRRRPQDASAGDRGGRRVGARDRPRASSSTASPSRP